MHERDELRRTLLEQQLVDRRRDRRFRPAPTSTVRTSAPARRAISAKPLAEIADDDDDRAVARLEQIHHDRLESRRAGRRDRERVMVRRCGTRSRSAPIVWSISSTKYGSRWPTGFAPIAASTRGSGLLGPGPMSKRSGGSSGGGAPDGVAAGFDVLCGRRHDEPQFLCESDALQLARRAHRNLRENQNLPRHLERRRAESTRTRAARLSVASVPCLQHDRRRDLFAEHVVRHRERHALVHGGMLHDDLVDFARRNLLAAAVDDLLQAAR